MRTIYLMRHSYTNGSNGSLSDKGRDKIGDVLVKLPNFHAIVSSTERSAIETAELIKRHNKAGNFEAFGANMLLSSFLEVPELIEIYQQLENPTAKNLYGHIGAKPHIDEIIHEKLPEVMSLVKGLASEGSKILLVTHSPEINFFALSIISAADLGSKVDTIEIMEMDVAPCEFIKIEFGNNMVHGAEHLRW